MPLPNGVDLLLKERALPEGHISYFYDLLTPGDDSFINKIKVDWEKELNPLSQTISGKKLQES